VSRKPVIGWIAATVFLALSIAAFSLYAPLAYGGVWTRPQCNRVKLFSAWDWDCNNFFDSVRICLLHLRLRHEPLLTQVPVVGLYHHGRATLRNIALHASRVPRCWRTESRRRGG
jgi:hypothetical protein